MFDINSLADFMSGHHGIPGLWFITHFGNEYLKPNFVTFDIWKSEYDNDIVVVIKLHSVFGLLGFQRQIHASRSASYTINRNHTFIGKSYVTSYLDIGEVYSIEQSTIIDLSRIFATWQTTSSSSLYRFPVSQRPNKILFKKIDHIEKYISNNDLAKLTKPM